MQVIAVVELEVIDNKSVVKSVAPYQAINADTFAADWNDGQQARQMWEQFCNAFCHLLMESGFVDETGLHIEEYNAGSVFRFIRDNPAIIPESFLDTMVGKIVMQGVKKGAKDIKKGKDITINLKSIQQHAGPMTDAVLGRMVINPARRDLLQPLFDQYAKYLSLSAESTSYLSLPAESTPTTDSENE